MKEIRFLLEKHPPRHWSKNKSVYLIRDLKTNTIEAMTDDEKEAVSWQEEYEKETADKVKGNGKI